MLDADAVQQWFDLLDSQLAVSSRKQEQLAAGEILRRATLVNMHVRRLAQMIAWYDLVIAFSPRTFAPVPPKTIHRDVRTKMFLKQLDGTRGEVVAISDRDRRSRL